MPQGIKGNTNVAVLIICLFHSSDGLNSNNTNTFKLEVQLKISH